MKSKAPPKRHFIGRCFAVATSAMRGIARDIRPSKPHPTVRVYPSRINGDGLFVLRAFKAGDAICTCIGEIRNSRTNISIELNENEHFEPVGTLEGSINALAKVNHACKPNAYVQHDSKNGFLIIKALTDIPVCEEITIDYLATETELERPFACNCGKPDCAGYVGRDDAP